MYTGTFINDLAAMVERAEQRARYKRIVDEMELQRMFALQVPQLSEERVFAGAA